MAEYNNGKDGTIKTSLLSSNNYKMCGISKMKFALGVTALLIVDVIWVASSEASRVSKV